MIQEEEQAITPELVPLSSLSPAAWNPRQLKSERFRNLCQSIEADPEMLKMRPILATLNGTIYAGNMRYLAAKQLGFQSIWAIVGDVPERLAKERSLKDNNQWADWDDDKLRNMVQDLKKQGSDLDLLGFSDKELQTLLGDRGLPAPGDQSEDESEHLFGVVITCESEEQQVELLERLTNEGYDVRALVS